VSVIDPTSNTVIDTVGVGSGPIGVAFDPTNGDLYVTNDVGGTVSVIAP
jgi:DNA-binding beta-propeller fold protein YncE